VLVGLNPKLRGITEDVPFVPDARTLARTRLLALDDLLAMKRAAGRLQDLVDVEALEIARLRRAGRRD
jgi:hypothetical protein